MELTFISKLVDFQFWCIIGMLFSQSADNSMNETQAGGKWQLCYYALIFTKFVTSSFIKIPNQSAYKTLAKECHKQHQLIDAISSVSDGELKLKETGIGFGIGVGFIVCIILGVTYSTYIPLVLVRQWKMMWRRIPSWLKNYAHIIIQFFVIGLYAGEIPMSFYRLEKVRKLALQTIEAQPTGAEKWGYGQTTAILIWFPFFFSAMKETISKFLPGHDDLSVY
jgi:hypothetical protein